jgi:hypothetical protein
MLGFSGLISVWTRSGRNSVNEFSVTEKCFLMVTRKLKIQATPAFNVGGRRTRHCWEAAQVAYADFLGPRKAWSPSNSTVLRPNALARDLNTPLIKRKHRP